VLTDLNDQVVNVMFPAGDLIGLLGEFIATRFRVDVVSAEANEVEINDISVNAYYDPDLDERKKIAIELVLITNPNSQFIMLDDMTWLAFSNGIADSLAHELIHMRQHRLREFEDVSVRHATAFNEHPDAQEYLADPDEVDAYALSIAIELLRHIDVYRARKNLSRISVMSKMRKGTEFVSPNLRAYIAHFGLSKLTKKIAKKVYKHLGTIDKQHIFM
jgi:hypothetical protein